MAQNPRALTNRPGVRADELDRVQLRADDLRSAIARDVLEVESRLRRAFDPRFQAAKHPFIAAAVVLGGVFLATRVVQSVLGRIRPNRAGESRRRHNREILAVAYALGQRPGVSEADLKETSE